MPTASTSGWMASVLDITDRKRSEEFARMQQERLQATARLVTTGELASTLAHELNQPLAAIWVCQRLHPVRPGERHAA